MTVEKGVYPPKRTSRQKEVDRAQIPGLIRRGMCFSQIAEVLGISDKQVSADWRIIREQLRATRESDIQAVIDMKLLEYSELKQEAWQQWERSKRPLRSRTSRHVNVDSRNPASTTEDVETLQARCGDPRYLNVVLDCIKAERDLLGLDKAKTLDVTHSINWSELIAGVPMAVPDVIEAEIVKVLEGPKEGTNGTDSASIEQDPGPTGICEGDVARG